MKQDFVVMPPYREVGLAIGLIAAIGASVFLSDQGAPWFSANAYGLFMGGGVALTLAGGIYLCYHRKVFLKSDGERTPVALFLALFVTVICSEYLMETLRPDDYSTVAYEIAFVQQWQGVLVGGAVFGIAMALLALTRQLAAQKSRESLPAH